MMIILSAFLAGAAFVLAVFALAFTIADHYRAERVEKALLASIEDNRRQIVALGESSAALATRMQWAVEELGLLDRMIRAVASASSPPAASGKGYFGVPGPGTLQ